MSGQRRPTAWVGAAAIAVVVIIGALAIVSLRSDDDASDRGPIQESRVWAEAWENLDFEPLGRLADQPDEAIAAHDEFVETLGVAEASVRVAPAFSFDGETAVSVMALELTVVGEETVDYVVEVPWRRVDDDRWVASYSAATIHPLLGPGRSVRRLATRPSRGDLLDRDGDALRVSANAVEIAIQPSRMNDQAEVEAVLQQELDIPPEQVRSALEQPWVTPDSRVPIATLDADIYRSDYRDVLRPVPGLVFGELTEGRLPTSEFARHTIGTLGEVTAEQLEANPGRYRAGDTVGRSGLEELYETQLAGEPDVEIQVMEGSTVIATIARLDGTDPANVSTTLDPDIQVAADATLAGIDRPAALVAIDVASGEILAVSSAPFDDGFNRALSGAYPPGSTFKIVTTNALLANGWTTADGVPCPASTTVEGLTISNSGGESLGTVPLTEIFVRSCNTGFVEQAVELGADPLAASAESFGFNQDAAIGFPAVGGTFPEPSDTAELGAAAIGQARVTASPMQMASVAATAASGESRPPRLVIPPESATEEGLSDTVVPISDELDELMAAVVERGTGTAAAVSGLDVAGKTGTAEIADGREPHAWFVGFAEGLGYSEGIAFAVIVEEGGFGGRVAAPLAAEFLGRVRDATP